MYLVPSRKAHKQEGALNICDRRKASSLLGVILSSVTGSQGLRHSKKIERLGVKSENGTAYQAHSESD